MKKILIIDDQPEFSLLVLNALDDKKYSVRSALNAEEALKKLEHERPDLLLLDLNMPGMGGMAFLKKLNESEGEKIPVLITTNESSMEKITEGVMLGIRGYILKSGESIQHIVRAIDSVFA